MRTSVLLATVSLLVSASLAAAFPKDGAPAEAAKPAADSAASRDMIGAAGKVEESMSSGGYTYLLIQDKGGKKWVAVPQSTISKGDTVSVLPGAEMNNFSSKTLNKTFDKVIFSGGVVTVNGKPFKPAAASKGSATAIPAGEKIKVEKATGKGSYTVADVFGKRKKLNGKKVTVRGKVVKVSSGIMKRNWIHLQDGTGSAAKKTNNLVVTSEMAPQVGETVTITGVVASDKDFGAGYRYDVIVEKATVSK